MIDIKKINIERKAPQNVREPQGVFNWLSVICSSFYINQTQTWFIQRKVIQIQNISGHQYIK